MATVTGLNNGLPQIIHFPIPLTCKYYMAKDGIKLNVLRDRACPLYKRESEGVYTHKHTYTQTRKEGDMKMRQKL